METKADQLLASVVDPAMANNTGNPEWIRRLVLVSDPRLDEVSETAWYLAADPNQHDTIVRAYLAGEPRPYLEENSELERDAIGHKCRLDFGVGVIDYRGLCKNARTPASKGMQAAGEKLAIARRLCGPRGRGPQAPEVMADTL